MRIRLGMPLLLVLGGLVACGPAPEPPADYGDAPDGDLGMGTGYYGFSGSGFGVYTLVSQNGPADFPTVGTDAVAGPFHLDVDDFWIGPMFVAPTTAATAPSVEAGATDPLDPDGSPNLTAVPQAADNDFEGPPVSAIVLIIVVAVPPPAIFLSSASVLSFPAGDEGAAYWNVLIDLNQSGTWDNTLEWVAQDIFFPLIPNSSQFLVSPAFQWPTAGGGFGRLVFPEWARNMVTDRSVRSSVQLQQAPPIQYWDGRGPAGGFAYGEVEDYFIEWSPIGPMYVSLPPTLRDRPGAAQFASTRPQEPGQQAPAPFLRDLAHVTCPEEMAAGETVACELGEPAVGAVTLVCVPDAETGGVAAGSVRLESDGSPTGSIESEACGIDAQLEGGTLSVSVQQAATGTAILVIGEVADPSLRRGSDEVLIAGGARISIP